MHTEELQTLRAAREQLFVQRRTIINRLRERTRNGDRDVWRTLEAVCRKFAELDRRLAKPVPPELLMRTQTENHPLMQRSATGAFREPRRVV